MLRPAWISPDGMPLICSQERRWPAASESDRPGWAMSQGSWRSGLCWLLLSRAFTHLAEWHPERGPFPTAPSQTVLARFRAHGSPEACAFSTPLTRWSANTSVSTIFLSLASCDPLPCDGLSPSQTTTITLHPLPLGT